MESSKEKCRIAILDNNEIEKLKQLKRHGISIEEALIEYDYILIPGWVWEEVCDSSYRKEFILGLQRKGLPIKILFEKDYVKVIEEELRLIEVFSKVILPFAELKRFFREQILKRKDPADIDFLYEEWIELLYTNWPLHGRELTRSSGEVRAQKKNAGEISIAFLVYLLKLQKKVWVDVTVWTHDGDCRTCMAKLLEKEKYFSYKNLDNILQECWKKGVITIEQLESLVKALREERRISYLYKKIDNSSEIRTEVLSNESYVELVMNDLVEFIF